MIVQKAIQVEGLVRDYNGRRALFGIHFTVEEGEIFGFLGPNGAGKTTTIKILTGQLRPTAGLAHVMGYDVVGQRAELKSLIGVVFEYQNLYERLSARNNLNFTADLYGQPKSRVDEMLSLVGLQSRADDSLKELSHGMKQRLLIARSLLHHPKVLFLDEPTRGLDPNLARDIRILIKGLPQQGVTVFLTTHYMEEADHLCDRVAILDQGRIVAMDTPLQLKTIQNRSSLEDVFIDLTGHGLISGHPEEG